MLSRLDAAAVRRWCGEAAESLAVHRIEIDDLNVFPSPDGDTGTNLALTLRSAAEAVAGDQSPGAGGVLRAMARGALLGARGNSGVIMSQVLRGVADTVDPALSCDGGLLAAALGAASDAAYAAVAAPVEGTILSVIRAAAAGAETTSARGTASLADVVGAAAAAAQEALRRTTSQLEVLARAGVVDAGGRGLVVVLDALAAVVTGRGLDPASATRPARSQRALETVREMGSSDYGYEVQFLLTADERAVSTLRATLAGLGDSLAVVGSGDGLFNVHVHVNDIGAALEAGIEAGRPHRISVVRFADQLAAQRLDSRASDGTGAAEGAASGGPVGAQRSGTAVVAVAPGEGLADLFRAEGVAVVDGGATQNPSTAEVLDGILRTDAARVVLLPNASAIGGTAEMAAQEARRLGVAVAVLPTKSPVQGLAAVAIHDPQRRFSDDVIAMAEAAAATHFAEVTVAVRDAITYAGPCRAGDVLGLIDGEVVEIGSAVDTVATHLVGRLLAAGGELVTVLIGADPRAAPAAAEVQRLVRRDHPLVEITCLVGGQPHYPLLIGVE